MGDVWCDHAPRILCTIIRRSRADRAEELDAKIEQTDRLIDEIVYELYGLTDEEIEIVDDGDAKHKREQIETDLISAHWLASREAPRDQF